MQLISGKITFGSTVAPGQSTPLDQNLNIDNHTAISDQSGFTHTPQSDGTIESYEIQFTMGTAPDGTLSVSLYTVDANGFPDTLLETSDVSDITTWNPGQTPTDVIFTLANPVNVTSGTTYAVIYNLTFSTGVPFSAKDNSESDLDGQIIRLNSAGGIYEVSTEPSDAYFIANGISIQGGSELNISEDMYIQCPGLPDVANTIQAQSITIDNGQVAYVEINRDSSVVTNLTPVVAGIEGVPAQDNVLVIARRRDDQIYVGVNHTIRLEQGECLQLDEAGAGGGSDVNGSVVINNVSTGSMDGEMGRTVGINNPVMDFQNITNVGQISDMLTFDDTTGLFTVTKTGVFIATGSGNSISGTSGAAVQINGVEVSRENGGNTTFDSSATWSGLLVVGETIAFTSTNGGMDMYKFSISGISTEQLTLNGANMTPASIINPVFEVNEHLTGETWIDGRPVYRRVLNFTNNVTTAQLLDTWDPGLTFLDSLRKVSDTEWVLEIHNASGTFNRSTIVYDEITGEVSSENVDGVGRIEAGTNFIFKYVKP